MIFSPPHYPNSNAEVSSDINNFVSYMRVSLQQFIRSSSPSSPIHILDVVGENGKIQTGKDSSISK